MNKKLIISGVCGIALLLLGAVTVENIKIQSRTVSSWSELLNIYYSARKELPPLPLQTDNIINQIAANDWSFLSDHWQIRQPGGTLYVSDKSELAKELKLPVRIQSREELLPLPNFPSIGKVDHSFSKPWKLSFQPSEKMV